MNKKKLVTSTLLFSIVLSTLPYQVFAIDKVPPVPVSDSALRDKEAGLTIFGYTVPGLTWDSILILATKITIRKLVDSTVKWINSGFEGNPAFVTDPKQYFTDIADGIAGEFIQSSEDLGFLCSPFQANIKLSLAQEYYESQPFQCTLSEVLGNTENAIEDFYNDFSKGGWDAWFSMTQNPTNNPYGSYLKAKVELDSRIANAVGLKKNQLEFGDGFLSWQPCAAKNPEPFIRKIGPDGLPIVEHNPNYVPSKAVGECIKEGPIQTPGSVINSQLANVLGTGVRQLELADEFDEIVNALVAQLLKSTVFNSEGGLAKAQRVSTDTPTSQTPRPGSIDVDGDGIPDATDVDGDGLPDICLHGGADGATIGPPCRGSGEVPNPPPNWGSGGTGGGGQCSVSGQRYQSALGQAFDEVTVENPEVANLPNLESNNRQNARTFIALVASKLRSMGYEASDSVLNGNNNPNTGDLIALWRSGDSTMERYDVIEGEKSPPETLEDSVVLDFTGFIPLNCTASGGGRDCGCKSNTSGGSGGSSGNTPGSNTGGGTSTPGSPVITSVNPTTAQRGVTTITISGSNLSSTVQFFDGAGARYTVSGTVNSASTQTTVLVPSDLPVGNATVKVYKSSSSISNGILIQVTGTASGSGSSYPAITTFAQKNLGEGVFPDVAWLGGKLYVAVKQGNAINLYRASPDLSDMAIYKTFPVLKSDNSFPRLTSHNNILWLAWRDDTDGLYLWRSDTDTKENLGQAFGNDPVALGNGQIVWQNSTNYQIVRRLLTGGTISNVKTGGPTGINQILSNGTVVTVDQTLYEQTYKASFGVRSWTTGNLVIAEHQTSGLVGEFNNSPSTRFSLFPGIAATPHAAFDGTYLYAIATWGGGGTGVRVTVIKR